MSEERFDRIDQTLAHLGAGLENVDHNMHVLHEDALSRIAAVAESVVVLDQKMERGFAEVKADMDHRLTEVRTDMDRGFAEVRADMDHRFAEVKTDMDHGFAEVRADMDHRFADVRTDMDHGFAEVRADMDHRFAEVRVDMDRRFADVKTNMDSQSAELRRHMGVLHEEALGRIAATQEYTGPTKAEMNHAFADLKETITRRLDPLEAAARQHSAALRRHDAEIASLKRRRK
jgi:DNA anti-recombination protein RmuC